MLLKLKRILHKTSLVAAKIGCKIKYYGNVNYPGSGNSIYVFSISGSIALLKAAQFNCQFLCASKVLPPVF